MNNEIIPINVSVGIYHNKPCLEFRKKIDNINTIKNIISAIYHEKPIIVLPITTNKLRFVNSLCEKGLVYRKDKDYLFTF